MINSPIRFHIRDMFMFITSSRFCQHLSMLFRHRTEKRISKNDRGLVSSLPRSFNIQLICVRKLYSRLTCLIENHSMDYPKCFLGDESDLLLRFCSISVYQSCPPHSTSQHSKSYSRSESLHEILIISLSDLSSFSFHFLDLLIDG